MREELHVAMRPFNILSSFFGMAPLTLSNEAIQLSWHGSARSLLFFILFTTAFTYNTLHNTNSILETTDFINKIGLTAQGYAYTFIAVIMICYKYIHRHNIVVVLTKLEQFENEIYENFESYLPVNFSQTTMECLKKTIICVFYFSAAIIPDFILLFDSFYYRDDYYLMASLIFVSYTPVIILTIMVFQFGGILTLIYERFQFINLLIKQLFIEQHSLEIRTEGIPQTDIYNKVNSLRTTWDLYSKMIEIAQLLNESYQVQLLFYIGFTFVIVVTQTYNISLIFIDSTHSVIYDDVANLSSSLLWVAHQMMGLILIAITCERTCNEASKTAILLHKISYRHEYVIKEIIELWSVQILHERLRFTARGFFDINMSLVYSIVGSMTTYLIILIQFNIAGVKNMASLEKKIGFQPIKLKH